jgi:hypothetical protein
VSEQPIESLDFHPIASTPCDMCIQLSVARVDTGHGPLFFCRHHLNASFASPESDPRVTFATVSL